MSNRAEILDMAVHALSPLLRKNQDAQPDALFDGAIEIGQKLVSAVHEAAAKDGAPPLDELMDMGVHALSALLNGRLPDSADEVMDECIAASIALIEKVNAELGDEADEDKREELLDMAVHVQTAVLTGRPQMDAHVLADHCVVVAKDLIAKVDATLAD